MKKTNYLMTLLLTLALVLSMSMVALAESKSFTGDVTYDGGSSMKSNYDGKDIAASAADLEPGDDVTITITYNNRSQKTTDWYMRNSVLQTLEESGTPAENGGYTYTLTDSKAGVIYSNDEVGGNKQTGIPEGLKQATASNEGEYFSINTLAPGEKGTTTLHIAFEGETEVNDYQTTAAKLDLQYAVEEHGVDTTETKVINRMVKTGDSTKILRYVLTFGVSLLLFLLALISWKKDRRKGGENA
ncbi:MAG: hypothetical protein IKE85_10380 [Mogibacterium sp.]|nr:hypothetical protein [Mogibacterium sp.]